MIDERRRAILECAAIGWLVGGHSGAIAAAIVCLVFDFLDFCRD
jgi:hypothetical protein